MKPRFWIGLALFAGGVFYLLSESEIGSWLRALVPNSSTVFSLALPVALGLIGVGILYRNWEITRRETKIHQLQKDEIAAYLHDSVLQTLALIQKSASDPAQTIKLARKQERELRRWLYGRTESIGSSAASSLQIIAQSAEEEFGAEIELVIVGDTKPTAQIRELLSAATQAIVNAAEHGSPDYNVYAQFSPSASEITVRDHGAGFDISKIPEDRGGVRHSIIGRMEKIGGKATIKSRAHWGTEVLLVV